MLQPFGKKCVIYVSVYFFLFRILRKCFKCMRLNFNPRAINLKIGFPKREFLSEVPTFHYC